MLRAIVFGGFEGKLSVVNPKEYKIQEIKSYAKIVDILAFYPNSKFPVKSRPKNGNSGWPLWFFD